MSKKQSSPSSQVQKEETNLSQLEMEISVIRQDYSNPDNFDSESNLLKEFNKLCKEKELTEDQKKRKKEALNEIGMMYGLENGIWIANLSYSKDYLTLARMRQKVIRDYHCKSSLELMLADSIVASYWRIIKNEMILSRLIQKEDGSWSFNQSKVNVMKELNKGIDLASRRLNTNIVLLKEMKQPTLKVNVKTNNAFIGDKQQFNNNHTKKDENNEAK